MTTKKITVGYFGFKKLDSGQGKVLIKTSNNKWYSSTLFKDIEAAKEFASAFPKPRKGDKIKMALAEPNEKGYSDVEGWTLDENAKQPEKTDRVASMVTALDDAEKTWVKKWNLTALTENDRDNIRAIAIHFRIADERG